MRTCYMIMSVSNEEVELTVYLSISLPYSLHAIPSLHCLIKRQLQPLSFMRALRVRRGATDRAVRFDVGLRRYTGHETNHRQLSLPKKRVEVRPTVSQTRYVLSGGSTGHALGFGSDCGCVRGCLHRQRGGSRRCGEGFGMA